MEMSREGVGTKIVSLLCAVVLALGLMPAVALADDDTTTETETATTVTVDGVDYTTYDVTFDGTGDYSGSTWDVLGTMVYKYFGYDVYVSDALSDGSYNIVVYFGGESGYSSAIEDFTVYTDSTNSTTDYTVSQSTMTGISSDPVYVFNVDDPSETIYCYLYIGGSMGMGVTFSIDVDWAATDASEDEAASAESLGYTLYYKCADSTSQYGSYFGHFVDGAFESGEVDVVTNDDGTYTVTIVADGTSSMLSDVYMSFDEDVAVTSSTDDAGYITYVLTLDSITDTIDFTFGYTIAAMNMSMSHNFQMVLDGGTWSGHDYVAGEADEDGVVTYTCSVCGDSYGVYPFTLYYNAADSTSQYGGYFGHFVDGAFESGSVEVVTNDDGTYTVTIVADGTSSMLSDVYMSFDEDVAVTSSTDDAGYITYVLTLDSITDTIDFTFGYTIAAMNMSMSHDFQLVLAGGTYSSDDSSDDSSSDEGTTDDDDVTSGATGEADDESDDGTSEDDSSDAATGDYTVSFVQSDGETASMMASYIEDATAVANEDGTYTISFSLTETGASMISSVSYDGSELVADDSGAYSITVSSIDDLIPVSMYVSMMGSSVTAYISVEVAASDEGSSDDDSATDGDDVTSGATGEADSGSEDGDSGTDSGTDEGTTDEGATDEGSTDEGTTDEGTTDEGSTDEGSSESGSTDEGSSDEGSDSGSGDEGATEESEDAEEEAGYQFTDVQDEGKYYFEAVYALADADIINGVSETLYGVGQDMTRAQFATILYRVAGSPDTSYDAGYADVADGKYYTDAINWAAEQEVVTGYTNGKYGVNDELSFEDMCLIIARYANGGDSALQAAVSDSEAASILSAYADGDSVAAYADNGMAWCVTEGLVTGNTDGTIVPQEDVSRERAATVVARWLDLV